MSGATSRKEPVMDLAYRVLLVIALLCAIAWMLDDLHIINVS